jgi:hypothetical protein
MEAPLQGASFFFFQRKEKAYSQKGREDVELRVAKLTANPTPAIY